jgi:hypothetical protein
MTTTSTTTTTLPCPDPEGDSAFFEQHLHTFDATHVGGSTQVWQICPGDVDWFTYDPLETSTNPNSVFQTLVSVIAYSAVPPPAAPNQFAVEIHLGSRTGPLMAPLQSASNNPTINGSTTFFGQPNMPMQPVYLKVSAGPLTVAGQYMISASGTQN